MISDKVSQYTTIIKKGCRQTLRDKRSEAHSVMYIRALNDIELVDVDHALISDKEQNKKKSDFLIRSSQAGNTYIIELKGANIEEAFKQVIGTIAALDGRDDTKELVVHIVIGN